MPRTTALRRALTLVVGVLFAVVFVCSGASATRGATTDDRSAVGAHTSTSKAAARALEHAGHVDNKTPSPLQLASTGPYDAAESPLFEADHVADSIGSQDSTARISTSDRAPPAL